MRTLATWLALAAAGLLGVGAPLQLAVEAADSEPDQVSELEASLLPWRGELARAGTRLHLGLDEDPRRSTGASARIFATAYALAPAEVVPVVLTSCGPGQGGCGLAGATRLLLCGGALGDALGLAIRYGLTGVAASGSCVLLRRPGP